MEQRVVANLDSREWHGLQACVSLLPRDDGRVCFDIRDADTPPKDPTLLHFGCTTLTVSMPLPGSCLHGVVRRRACVACSHAAAHVYVVWHGLERTC